MLFIFFTLVQPTLYYKCLIYTPPPPPRHFDNVLIHVLVVYVTILYFSYYSIHLPPLFAPFICPVSCVN